MLSFLYSFVKSSVGLDSAPKKQETEQEMNNAKARIEDAFEKETREDPNPNSYKTGTVTFVSTDYVLIDDYYVYETNLITCGLKVRDKIHYIVSSDENQPHKVTKILTTTENETNSESRASSVIGKVVDRKNRLLIIEPNEITVDLNKVASDFVPVIGDWLRLESEVEINENEYNSSGQILEIRRIQPLRSKLNVATVSSFDPVKEVGVIGKDTVFDKRICDAGYAPCVGDKVISDSVESDQGVYKWRALSVVPMLQVSSKDSKSPALLNGISTKKNLPELLRNKCGISIEGETSITLDAQEEKLLTITVKNTGNASQMLRRCCFMLKKSHSQLTLIKPAFNCVSILNPSNSLDYEFKCTGKFVGISEELFIFNFKGFEIARIFNITVKPKTVRGKFSSKPKRSHNKENLNECNEATYIPGIRPCKPPFFVKVRNAVFRVPKCYWEIVTRSEGKSQTECAYEVANAVPCLSSRLRFESYRDRFHALLYLEEIAQTIDMQQYSLESAFMRRCGEYLAMQVPGLAEKRPSLLVGDRAIVSFGWDESRGKLKYEGYIHKVSSQEIFLKFNQSFHEDYNGEDCRVSFKCSYSALQRCHNAINLSINRLGESFLFPNRVVEKESQVELVEPEAKPCLDKKSAHQRNDSLSSESSNASNKSNGTNKSFTRMSVVERLFNVKPGEIIEVTKKESPIVELRKKESPIIELTKKESPIIELTKKESPIIELLKKESQIIELTKKESQIIELTKKESAIIELTKKPSPIIELTNKESQIIEITKKESPIIELTEKPSPIIELTKKESAIIELTKKPSPIIELTKKESAIIELTKKESAIIELTNKESPIIELTNKESPIIELTNKESPIIELTKKPSQIIELTKKELPIIELTNKESPIIELPKKQSQIIELTTNKESPIVKLTKKPSPIIELTKKPSPIIELPNKQSPITELPNKKSPITELPTKKSPITELPNKNHDQFAKNVTSTKDSLNSELQPFISQVKKRKLIWFRKNLNRYQKEAVRNILKGHARPLPYIIFGPPGTGKTVTLCETILQIMSTIPESRLLVATPSNSSANLIAERLLDSGVLKPGDMVRIIAHHCLTNDSIPPRLLPYCATADLSDESTIEKPKFSSSGPRLNCTMSILGRHRITIGTCVALGVLNNIGFPRGHFSHVLVDEAGQATEPEIMVPLNFVHSDYGQVILAGDPLQLGPVVQSRIAKNFGLDESFLSRLLRHFPYQRDPNGFEAQYDPRVVTKLVINYRSLPEILELSSSLFYDSELKATVSSKSSEEAKLLEKLVNELPERKGSPPAVVFHGVNGENCRDEDSPSWYNPEEATQVYLYLLKLYRCGVSPDDVGIITPYQKQVSQIRELLMELETDLPKISSVEGFQGQERNIIIISAVRSCSDFVNEDIKHSLGFVACPRRLNVAVTRARALVIVLGNPKLLARDPYWRSVLIYCINRNSYTGCSFGFDEIEEEEREENSEDSHCCTSRTKSSVFS